VAGWAGQKAVVCLDVANLRRRVLEVCLAVPFAACRGRSARDYIRKLADDNAS